MHHPRTYVGRTRPVIRKERYAVLDEVMLAAVELYFLEHPVLSRHLPQISVCLTGSYAFGLGGRGADVDLKVIAVPSEFERIREELIASGRITRGDDPEEDLTGLVGDYALESTETIREAIRDYRDLTQVFIYGHLAPILGNPDLTRELVAHCRSIPDKVLEESRQREDTALSQAVYAFLRSFQTRDVVGRMLSRAAIVRSAMRLTFLREAEAPPYDKHLYRLLPRLQRGAMVDRAISRFLEESQVAEEERYGSVASSLKWHEMYRYAEGTPVMVFRTRIETLLR